MRPLVFAHRGGAEDQARDRLKSMLQPDAEAAAALAGDTAGLDGGFGGGAANQIDAKGIKQALRALVFRVFDGLQKLDHRLLAATLEL